MRGWRTRQLCPVGGEFAVEWRSIRTPCFPATTPVRRRVPRLRIEIGSRLSFNGISAWKAINLDNQVNQEQAYDANCRAKQADGTRCVPGAARSTFTDVGLSASRTRPNPRPWYSIPTTQAALVNHLDQPPAAAAAGASVSATAGHYPGVTSSDGGVTTVLAKAPHGTPVAALKHCAQPAAGALVPPPMAGGHDDPGVASHREEIAELVGSATLGRPVAASKDYIAAAAMEAAGASLPLDLAWIRARRGAPAEAAGGGHAEREELRRERRESRRLLKVPTDYLRAGQESRERRRRRAMVRRCLRKLFSVHKNRASERSLSAMMARLTKLASAATAGDGEASEDAVALSSEDAELGELLDKMELSTKD